jgi:ferric-dicitrate binding protein FerR (iron transport regulator)
MRGANGIWRALGSLLSARWPLPSIRWRVGLGVTILIAAHFPLSQSSHDGHGEAALLSWRTFNTDFGAPSPVALEDGSVLHLGPSTQIQVGFSGDRRLVVLVRGEAEFNVAHNSKRPFDILAAGTTVRAVGTEFLVRIRPAHSVLVRVTEGVVQVTSSAQMESKSAFYLNTAQLRAGDIAVSDSHGIVVAAQGWLTFNRETLAQAVEQVNRFGWAQFEIADPRITQRSIAGAVHILEPDSFLPILQPYHITSQTLGQSPSGSPRFRLRAFHQPAEPHG